MSLFIAGQAFHNPRDYVAAKIAIFMASVVAGIAGVLILWPRRTEEKQRGLPTFVPLAQVNERRRSVSVVPYGRQRERSPVSSSPCLDPKEPKGESDELHAIFSRLCFNGRLIHAASE
jgi:hypothetical protein